MGAAAGEDDHEHSHEEAGDGEEGAQRDLDAGEADEQEDGHEQHDADREALPDGGLSAGVHGEQGLVEHDGLRALAEHGQEGQGGQGPEAAVGDGGLGAVLDVAVPGLHGGLRQHPVGGEQEHPHGDEGDDALEDLLVGGGGVVQEGEEHGDDAGADQAQDDAGVDVLDAVLHAGLDEVGDDRGDHEDRLEPLAQEDDEGLPEGPGEEGRDGVDVLGGAAVELGGVLLDVGDEGVGFGADLGGGGAGDHGLADHLELVLHHGDAVPGDCGHDGLLEAEFLVVPVVGLVDVVGPAVAVAVGGLVDPGVDEGRHLRGDLGPGPLATTLVDLRPAGLERGALGGDGRGPLGGVVARAGQVRQGVEPARVRQEGRRQRGGVGRDGLVVAGRVGGLAQGLEGLLLGGGDVLAEAVDGDQLHIGGHVAGVVGPLEGGGRAGGVAAGVGGHRLVELGADVLGHLGPRVEVRVGVVGRGVRVRSARTEDPDEQEQRGQGPEGGAADPSGRRACGERPVGWGCGGR